MEDIIILKIFSSRNGRRSFRPKEQKKFISLLDANKYIADNNLLLYDLLLNNKILDRNGNGTVEKMPKKDKSNEIRFLTITKEAEVIAFINKKTNVSFKNIYPFKKDGNEFAATMTSREDANKVYKYLKGNAAFSILQVDAENLSLSFAVITNDFNETIKWQPKEIPQTSTTSNCKTLTELCRSFTWPQLLAILD